MTRPVAVTTPLADGWQPGADPTSYSLIRHGVAVANVWRATDGMWEASPGGPMATAVDAMELASFAATADTA